MSYYYSFDQYPAKQLDALWEAFMQGTLTLRLDESLMQLSQDEKEAEKLPTVSKATFYEDREEWMRCEKNKSIIGSIRRRKERLQDLKNKILESQALLQTTKDKGKIKKIVTSVMEQLNESLREIFFPECTGYSESMRDLDFLFFNELFQMRTGRDLSTIKTIPTREDWKMFYQSLTAEFLTTELKRFFKEHAIREKDQWDVRNQCLELLYTIRDLLKTCLKRDWELLFFSENGENDPQEKAIKDMSKKRVQLFIDTFGAS